MTIGWHSTSKDYKGGLHPKASRYVLVGCILGILASSLLVLWMIQWWHLPRTGWGVEIPTFLMIPPSIGMLFGAVVNRARMSRRVSDGGIYCVHCLYDLRGSLESRRCPECGNEFNPSDVKKGMHFGVHAAWRATWVGFVGCILGTLIGYGLLMAFLSPLSKR